ncbi:MAG: Mur ligase family protein, partial [Sandaracinobacteroides sp.]
MSALWTGAEIAAATGGALSAPFEVGNVCFDSREVIGGELFVAMRGLQADGHLYVDAAAGRGATGFLVERPVSNPHVLVADSFAALEALGLAARARTAATIVGVTGSVGKTGTKEALRLAFERIAPFATHASVKSYNNHTGVPLSLARMPESTRYGVFEMGMN